MTCSHVPSVFPELYLVSTPKTMTVDEEQSIRQIAPHFCTPGKQFGSTTEYPPERGVEYFLPDEIQDPDKRRL